MQRATSARRASAATHAVAVEPSRADGDAHAVERELRVRLPSGLLRHQLDARTGGLDEQERSCRVAARRDRMCDASDAAGTLVLTPVSRWPAPSAAAASRCQRIARRVLIGSAVRMRSPLATPGSSVRCCSALPKRTPPARPATAGPARATVSDLLQGRQAPGSRPGPAVLLGIAVPIRLAAASARHSSSSIAAPADSSALCRSLVA
jgi:hypothetical protein